MTSCIDGELRTKRVSHSHEDFSRPTDITQMTWYIIKGENLRRDREVRYSYVRHIPRSYTDNDLQFKDELWVSDAVVGPTHPTKEIKVSCVLESDLNSVNKSLFKKVRGIDGRKWWGVSYDLVISTREAAMKFWLEFDGKEAGALMAKYD